MELGMIIVVIRIGIAWGVVTVKASEGYFIKIRTRMELGMINVVIFRD
jgi:hypothetical protein